MSQKPSRELEGHELFRTHAAFCFITFFHLTGKIDTIFHLWISFSQLLFIILMCDYFLHTWSREQPGVFFKFHFLKGNISIFQCMFVFFVLLASHWLPFISERKWNLWYENQSANSPNLLKLKSITRRPCSFLTILYYRSAAVQTFKSTSR